jgi:DNA-binding IclR family transcriptional regulator
MKVTMEDAVFLPFHAPASGAAVLAFLPEAEAPRLLGAGPSADLVRARMHQCRTQGWTETLSTFEKDVQGIAVPLFDATGACSGALAVAAAAPRMTPDLHAVILTELTRAGAEITALWGGRPPQALANLWTEAATSAARKDPP